MSTTHLQSSDYMYSLHELSGSQRLRRLSNLANALAQVAIDAGGTVEREQALAKVSNDLGITEEEVRRGIVFGEGNRLFTKSPDGLRLQVL